VGVLNLIGLILVYAALHMSLLSLVTVLLSLYPAVTVVLAVVVLRERGGGRAVGGGWHWRSGAGRANRGGQRLTPILLALCTASVLGVSDFLAGVAGRQVAAIRLVLVSYTVVADIAGGVCPAGRRAAQLDWHRLGARAGYC